MQKNNRKNSNENRGYDESFHKKNQWGESVSNLPTSPIFAGEKTTSKHAKKG